MKTEITSEAAKAIPPLAITVMAHTITLNDVVLLGTILYLAVQIGYLIWKWRRDVRRDKEQNEDR